MGRYYAVSTERMDMLGHFREKSGDEEYTYREGTFEAKGWNAQTLLLGGVPSSLKGPERS